MSIHGDDDLYPGGGFLYEQPLVLGPLVIESSHDYVMQIDLIHSIMSEIGIPDDEIQMADDDCGLEGDVDSAFATIEYFQMYLGGVMTINLEGLQKALSGVNQQNYDVPDDMSGLTSKIKSLATEFSLDAYCPDSTCDRVHIPEYEPEVKSSIIPQHNLTPPRPPVIHPQEGPVTGILLCKRRSHEPFRLRSHLRWSDMIGGLMPSGADLGKEEHFSLGSGRRPSDAAFDIMSSSTLESLSTRVNQELRSNSRPKGGIVMAVMATGEMHNIGSHSYKLSSDILMPMELTNIDNALSELFSAPAGEDMACPTGSHSLHQMSSACLAQALSIGKEIQYAECETGIDDITVYLPGKDPENVGIDITTTSGIFHKPLSRRKMVALSKYDLASVFLHSCPGRPAKAFAAALSCCLAVEHPAYYGLPNLEELPEDLSIQYRISIALNRMSQKTIQSLASMSYHAVVKESVRESLDIDIHAEGRPFKEKAQILLDSIHGLKHKDMYAVPPFPIGEITGMYPEPTIMPLLGIELYIPPAYLATDDHLQSIRPPDNLRFLQCFPASARFTYDECWEFCSVLRTSMFKATGLTHKGPVQEVDEETEDKDIWDKVSESYASSAIAQFAEIRADVVRAIDNSPTGNPMVWRSKMIYKGKVVLWYRIRDPVTDARGYRIDWFCVSTFPTIGAYKYCVNESKPIYVWPRQRMRSQEMEHAAMAPRRLKLTLFSMASMVKVTKATLEEVMLAWQKIALTTVSATWASGANYITCRHLSASLSSPSPPFEAMASKFKSPKTLACIVYFDSLCSALKSWDRRDQYHDRAAILDLPRAFCQLEAYWQVWVPDEFADANKNFTDCVLGLYKEYADLDETFRIRREDLLNQLELVTRKEISFVDLCESVRASCTLETGGKFGWSVFGSMGSAYALSLQGAPKHFDKSFSRGGRARTLVDHLTVRHSARLDHRSKLQTGTVAEMILSQGVDDYLSVLEPMSRFYYGNRPYFINHPKLGELKEREISITDPDSRIALNDAEHICGEYGRYTSVDMLKRPDKDAHFYKISSEAILKGGVIQASDASRFAAMMSNIAVSITCATLGNLGGSAHLKASASVYQRLASRRMVIDTIILDEINKRLEQDRDESELKTLRKMSKWIRSMTKIGQDGANTLRSYTTAAHTGQGMSHIGMSLEHGGALLISIAAAEHAQIYVSGKRAHVAAIPLVTSDDSTIVSSIDEIETKSFLTRHERQRACQMFLKIQRECRKVALRSVSIMQNLSKEKASGIAGEFNSQDNGIGVACPVLGYREMVCQLVRPSSSSLIVDYLSAHAYGKTVALSGLGLSSGVYAHLLMIDAIEQRWKLTPFEKKALEDSNLIPEPLVKGASARELIRPPASMLPIQTRTALMQMALEYHSESDILDIHTKDLAFTMLAHISISMKRQHQHAISIIKNRSQKIRSMGLEHQALILDSSLRSTLSSARSRNAGRIAQRVRGRNVKPGDCLGFSFQKAPIVETTLTWYDFLSSRLKTCSPGLEVKELAKTYGTYVSVSKVSFIRFPQPATKRRSSTSKHRKPKYILDSYGQTPFGMHAVVRSGASVISEFGPEQRRQMSLFYASQAYRSVPEHTQYGGRLNVSWSHATSGVLTPIAESEAPLAETPEGEVWGDMSEESISFLQEVEAENMGVPVLALNYASFGKAYFHGIHNGVDYSASTDFDPETAPRKSVFWSRARGGMAVILANQGWSRERKWYGSGPTGEEIEKFQHMSCDVFPNLVVEDTWKNLEGHSYTEVPWMACKQQSEKGDIIYMISPPMTRKCKPALIPYNRSKFVTSLATGGYWYSAIKGVSFRAFLKGHCGVENCWTGPVLGWRTARQSEPVYGWSPPEKGNVRSLAMIGGIDNDDVISVLNPQDFASTDCYVDKKGLHVVSEVHKLDANARNVSLILGANGGNCLFNAEQGKAYLIDSAVPATSIRPSSATPEECVSTLWDMTHSVSSSIDDLL
jgi:hypothetical protein